MSDLSPSDLALLQKAILDELMYFGTHLPFKDQDDISVILRGHLLLEEQLICYVCRRFHRPDRLGRFNFTQNLRLAEAANEIEAFDWVFESCGKLNHIRNKMAHALDLGDIETDIAGFVDYVVKQGHAIFPKELLSCNRPELRIAIYAVYGSLRNFNRMPLLSLSPPNLLLGALTDAKIAAATAPREHGV